MATTIKLKNGSGAPLAGDLVQGEPALDLTNKRLYTENASGTVIEVGTNPTSLTTGTFTSTGIDDNATSTAITIDSSENVGIGTASPSYPLDVTGTLNVGNTGSGFDDIRITGSSSSVGRLLFDDGTIAGQVRYDHSDDSMAFRTVNTERMRIDSSGNVGIGTTSPGAPLDVNGAIRCTTGFQMYDSGSVGRGIVVMNGDDPVFQTGTTAGARSLLFKTEGTERMRIDSSGNVGIGTTNPNPHGIGAGRIVTSYSTSGNLYGLFSAVGAGASGGGEIDFGNQTIRHAAVASLAGSNLTFYTNPNNSGSTVTERMRIDSSGRVGIGVSSPAEMLDIDEGSTATYIRMRNATSTTGYIGYGTGASATDMTFWTDGTKQVTLDGSGNLGIGATSPDTLLHLYTSNNAGLRQNYITIEDGDLSASGGNPCGGIDFVSNDSTNGRGVNARIENIYAGSGGGGTLVFSTSANSGSGVNEAMRIDASGNLLVGTTTEPSSSGSGSGFVDTSFGRNQLRLAHTDNTGGSRSLLVFYGGTAGNLVGTVTASNTTTTYNTTSDQRLKENIVDAPAGNIDAIQVRSFDWKADGSHQTYGMVAQELVDVAPEAVSQGETDDDMWGVDYSKLVPMMIKEIQDLRARVAQLEGA